MTEEIKEVIQAEEFQLVDAQGNVRARLGFVEGEPYLQFIDSQGCERIKIGISADEPGIRILNSDASTQAAIGAIDTGQTGIMLCDETGTLGMTMLIDQNRESHIKIYDQEGETFWAAP
ncbi:hypothetical protein [Gimesia sp.]|uniref:hypothetical protein n=1 Tax=Gimesia sp. TaxID=2024833 RepID=UPI0032EFFFDD